MPTLENDDILFNADASTLAFRAGQLMERLLGDRGLERARKAHRTIVSSDDIQACLSDELLEELRTHLNARAEHHSRKVA